MTNRKEGEVKRMTGQRDVTKLSDLSIDEVSLVDRGANQHAEVLIHKRDEEEEVDKADPDPSDVATSDRDEGEGDEGLDDEEEQLLEGAEEVAEEEASKSFFSRLVDKMFNREEDFTTATEQGGTVTGMEESEEVGKAGPQGMNPGMQLPYGMQPMGQPAPGPQGFMPQGQQAFPGQAGQMMAGPPLPQEVIQYIQQLEQALAQAQGSETPGQEEEENVNPFGKSAETLEDDEVAFLQELAKNLEDEDNREAISKALEMVEEANERAEEAEKVAKAERDFRLTQEYVSKARSLVNLPIDPEEFGPVLKRLNESMSEEDVEVLNKALSAANESIADAGVFTEVGKRGIEGYEAVSKLDAEAKALVEKSDGDLSMERAREQALEANPALYDEYLQETGR